MSSAEAPEQHPKKRVGRPSTKPKPPPLERQGVVARPDIEDDRLECVSDKPEFFKNLFSYLTKLSAEEVYVRCTPAGLSFLTRDMGKKSRVCAQIAGDEMVLYYFQGAGTFLVNLNSVKKVFSAIDRAYSKITFRMSHADPNQLIIVLKDFVLSRERVYEIAIDSDPADDYGLFEIEETVSRPTFRDSYPVQFDLDTKTFKKIVTDADGLGNRISIEKYGPAPEFPLQLKTVNNEHTVTGRDVFREPEKIDLVAKLAATESFCCSIPIVNIKPVSTATAADRVQILARMNGDMMFHSELDGFSLYTATMLQ